MDRQAVTIAGVVDVVAARVDWLEALVVSDDAFTDRFGIPVGAGWVGFPEALPLALDGPPPAGRSLGDPPCSSMTTGPVGFGGFKGEPRDGEVEVGYAVAPARQGRGIATSVVTQRVSRARAAGVRVVSAHAAENASATVLRKCGFARTGRAVEAVGEVWRWELTTTETATADCHQPID